jgi:hypothetical protein
MAATRTGPFCGSTCEPRVDDHRVTVAPAAA